MATPIGPVGRSVRRGGKAELVKAMTCEQLGGPCGVTVEGDTADEIIKAQDKHLKAMVAGGDATHQDALDAMKGRWRHPVASMGWYRTVKSDFASLPGDGSRPA